MNNTICCICGNEYEYIEGDTPTDFAMVCSNHCLEKLSEVRKWIRKYTLKLLGLIKIKANVSK